MPTIAAKRRRRFAIVAALAVLALVVAGTLIWQFHPGVPPTPPLSLVVLPFDNLGGNPKDDYLADGVTDDLTSDLSHIPGSFVIASASAYPYRGKARDIRRIGAELGVRYAVQGSVRRLGSGLRVDVQLISTQNGAQLWSDRFDQPISDLAEGQEQIVVRMRGALDITLTDIEAARSRREHPTNPDAFDLILQARAVHNLPATAESTTEVMRLSELALERDPNSVIALSLAVLSLTGGIYYGTISKVVALDRAARYVERARTIDPNSEPVLAAQVSLLAFQRQDAQEAVVAQRLIDNFPNSALATTGLRCR